jgi:molybdopterin molybdotransferase
VTTVSGPGSHLVAGLAASDVLIEVPTDTIHLDEGDLVKIWQL